MGFVGGVAVLFVLALITTDYFRAFGGAPSSSTLARMKLSPQFVGGEFVNAEPTRMLAEGKTIETFRQWLFGDERRHPGCPLPLYGDVEARLATPPASGLRVTWLGHSTTLIEIDGAVVVTDPIWSERASPSSIVGPVRYHPPPIALADLPRVDAVVISHEHFDHLDMTTVRALSERGVVFHVPLAVGAHLAKWGVPAERIAEHDWWQDDPLPGGVHIVSTPARHFNGRGVPWRTGALWTSWSIVGPEHRVFVSGDTGLTEQFREIKKRHGPFDVALLEIGQYHENWGEIHLGPAGALSAFEMLGAKALLPVHWGTFTLAYHDWSEPAETLFRLAEERKTNLFTPKLGEPVEPSAPNETRPWWRALPPIAASCP